MNAQVSVSHVEQFLEFIERERVIDGQSANNRQTRALMNQAVQIHGRGLNRLRIHRASSRLIFTDRASNSGLTRHSSSQSRRRKLYEGRRIPQPGAHCPSSTD